MILTFTSGLMEPSQLWMRRLCSRLADLSPRIIDLSVENASTRIDTVKVSALPSRPSLFRRIRSRLQLGASAWGGFQADWIRKQISETSPDAVLCHFAGNAVRFHKVWENLDLPVLIFCHGSDVTWNLRGLDGQPIHQPNYADKVASLPRNCTFLANSSATSKKLETIGISPDRIDHFRFGIQTDANPNWDFLAKRNPVALYLGRLIECKGPQETISACSKALANGTASRLLIAGDGPLYNKCKLQITELQMESKIQLLGSVSERTGAQLRNSVAVFTAHNQLSKTTGQEEALGVSLLEAMGAGLPVVTGRSGGIPDFIRHLDTGFLFEPGDIETHSEIISELMQNSDLRISVGKRAFELVKEEYGIRRERETIANAINLRLGAMNPSRL